MSSPAAFALPIDLERVLRWFCSSWVWICSALRLDLQRFEPPSVELDSAARQLLGHVAELGPQQAWV